MGLPVETWNEDEIAISYLDVPVGKWLTGNIHNFPLPQSWSWEQTQIHKL